MNKKNPVLVILMVFCILFVAASCGGGGGGGNGSDNGGDIGIVSAVSADDCLSVKVEKLIPSDFSIDIVGTVTNNCSRSVSWAVIRSYCYTNSGKTLGPDLASVKGLAVGEEMDFDALMAIVHDDPNSISRCTSDISDAFYD
jgi:hypothetical protein